MSDGKNDIKLLGDHIDFNLNLKSSRRLCLMLKKAFIPRKTVPETFDFLVSLVPSDIFVRHEILGDWRIEL